MDEARRDGLEPVAGCSDRPLDGLLPIGVGLRDEDGQTRRHTSRYNLCLEVICHVTEIAHCRRKPRHPPELLWSALRVRMQHTRATHRVECLVFGIFSTRGRIDVERIGLWLTAIPEQNALL